MFYSGLELSFEHSLWTLFIVSDNRHCPNQGLSMSFTLRPDYVLIPTRPGYSSQYSDEATGWTTGIRFRQGPRYFPSPPCPALLSSVYQDLSSRGWSGQNVELSTPPHLVPRLRIHGSIHLHDVPLIKHRDHCTFYLRALYHEDTFVRKTQKCTGHEALSGTGVWPSELTALW
jgi:hypothetical protein